MNNEILMILKNSKKLEEIKRIAQKYGVRLTSSVVLSIVMLLASGSAYQNDQDMKSVDLEITDDTFITKSIDKLGAFSTVALNLKINFEEVRELTWDEKIEIILDKFELSREQLDVCCAIACAEANGEGMNYEEAVNVICTAYNRIISAAWVNSLGDNLYGQMTAPGQFVVYENGNYLRFLGRIDLVGYQAVIDFLSNQCELKGHNYLSFRSNDSNIDGEELVKGGNLYFNELSDEDRLADKRVLEEVTRVLS